jgi:hypothetical protein
MSTVIDRIETRPTHGRSGAGNAPPGARPPAGMGAGRGGAARHPRRRTGGGWPYL